MADATSERDIVRAAAEERASVCSCTCYGRSSPRSRAGDDEHSGGNGGGGNGRRRRRRNHDGSSSVAGSSRRPDGQRMLWCLGRTFGCGESVQVRAQRPHLTNQVINKTKLVRCKVY